ncbi:MAG: sodium ion-translocating decarboxylase subunit beta, partial [Treponema sp.]|nr:sodium ion-translocating decarboxylase subunit beta [Treponema sp.]
MEDLFIGFTSLAGTEGLYRIIMILIGIVLITLAVKKEYEPMLLLPIGFGAILVNLP